MPNIPVSRSAILLPTTRCPSEDGLEMQDTMGWRRATVGNSQRTTPITIRTGGTAQVSTAVDSGMVVFVVLLA